MRWPASSRVPAISTTMASRAFSRSPATPAAGQRDGPLFGSAGVSGDLAGQLSNRFLYVPPVPEVPDPKAIPPPVTVGRSRRLLVHRPPVSGLWTGRRVHPDERAEQPVRFRVALSASSTTTICSNDYTTFFATGRTTIRCPSGRRSAFDVGVRTNRYDNSSDNSTIINPAVTVRTLLSEYLGCFRGGRRLFLQRGGRRRKQQLDDLSLRRIDLPFDGERPVLRHASALLAKALQGQRSLPPPP